MNINDLHKRALERFDALIDPDHIEHCEGMQVDLWAGKELDYLPSIVYLSVLEGWPQYSFTERWDDIEKNIISSLGVAYAGALVQDDRLYTLRA